MEGQSEKKQLTFFRLETQIGRFRQISTFIFDIDGVLTDGTVLLVDKEIQSRQMHVKDGLGLQIALSNGYKVIIISGGNSPESARRLNALGIKDVFLSVKDKKIFIDDLRSKNGWQWKELCYMGDDLPDIELLKTVGLSACPSDAVAEVVSLCDYVSTRRGGLGCVRELIERVMKISGTWNFDPGIVSK